MDKVNMCQHLNLITDQHEGCIVCTDCGEVIDVYFSQQDDSHAKLRQDFSANIKSYMIDCCDRMHVPDSIAEIILNEYVHFRSEAEFQKISDIQLMAYSIYFTLKNEDIGRNIEYVAMNTGITSKLLWKCESLDPYLAIPIKIESLLAPVYSLFELSREDYNNIRKISKHFQERHFSPLTLASTLVYLYCKTRGVRITIKKVCNIFHVSSMSIYRCKSYITQDKFHCILENTISNIDKCIHNG